MKKVLFILMLSFSALLLSSPSFGADLLKGIKALNNGNTVAALKELKPLARQGDLVAQYTLGQMYEKGHGVLQDKRMAIKFFRSTAEQGFPRGQTHLGLMYLKGWGVIKDPIYAHMWLNIGASNGNELGMKIRDLIEPNMTGSDISTARKLARGCVSKLYKGC